MVKRDFGVKDAGRFFGEHGGALLLRGLDRLEQLLLKLRLALAAQDGAEVSAVAERAREAAAAADVLFYVPSLDQLRRGGRINPAAGFFGSLLAIKPILTIRDGAIAEVEKIRTASKALVRMQQLVVRRIEELEYSPQLAVHYFGNEAEARSLAEELSPHVGDEILVTAVPSVLAAHAGLGVLAVVIGPAMPDPVS